MILYMSEEYWFRIGENAWLGVYAFKTLDLKKFSGDLDYAHKNMALYAVRLWLPEYPDCHKTSVVLGVFDGEFHCYVFHQHTTGLSFSTPLIEFNNGFQPTCPATTSAHA